MGCAKANDTGDNSPPDLKQYIDIGINETFQHPGYCEYCTQSNVNCGNNNEFVGAGNSGSKCKCRALCTDGCCRKLCKRVAYSGDPTECCQRGGPSYYLDNNNIVRTCDPIYRKANWKNNKCDHALTDYCKKGDNLFGETCRAWVTTFQPVGLVSEKSSNGYVDSTILEVCNRKEYATKDECACIVSANEVRQKLPSANNLPVQCMYNKCANNPRAYKTTSMLAPCNIVNCEMNINDMEIVAGDPASFNVGFSQLCGKELAKAIEDEEPTTPENGGSSPPTNKPTTPTNPPTNKPTTPTNPPNPKNPSTPPDKPLNKGSSSVGDFFKNYWYWFLIIIIIIIIIIVVVVVMKKKKKKI